MIQEKLGNNNKLVLWYYYYYYYDYNSLIKIWIPYIDITFLRLIAKYTKCSTYLS